jgi:hypothetical protein
MIAGWYLDILVGYHIRSLLRFVNVRRSEKWPVVVGAISSVTCPPAPYGGPIAAFGYTYIHSGHYYSGQHNKGFLLKSSAEDYVGRFVVGTQIGVRVKPLQPEKSVLVEP